MTPTELALYQLHAFDLGEIVEIDGSELFGEIVGLQIQIGREDEYLVSYHDGCGNPKREWWPASTLESVDDDEPESNVVCFDCARAERATRH